MLTDALPHQPGPSDLEEGGDGEQGDGTGDGHGAGPSAGRGLRGGARTPTVALQAGAETRAGAEAGRDPTGRAAEVTYPAVNVRDRQARWGSRRAEAAIGVPQVRRGAGAGRPGTAHGGVTGVTDGVRGRGART
ncbi:hypothetical protein GCM10022244_07050 [Streptomyces gulbargensis]|uniref:Uncharacterized protein n=1 Tax=Streptomyces gulbargensis TaxID=364901 RepID=A0ABP7LES4_9ACTN